MAKPTGRPTKWSQELQDRICLHLRYGATHRLAAAAEGITEETFYTWLKENASFSDAVAQAKAHAVTDKLALLHAAALRGSVPAITWLLERVNPEAFARPQEIRHMGPSGGPVEMKHTYERERPDRVFDILHEAGIVALNAGAVAGADGPAPDAVR